MKDLIVSSISKNYTWNDIQLWITSLKKTDYSGDILFFCYNFDGSEELLGKLKEAGIEIVIPNNTYRGVECGTFVFDSGLCTKDNSHMVIHNVRFFHTWQYLQECQIEYNRVVNTDIRDIVFQLNPTSWLNENLKNKILAPCEEVLYKNQNWNIQNSIQSFGPYVYSYLLMEKFVCNAGSFVADFETYKTICLVNYLMSCNTGINADQAGFNVLLNSVFKGMVQLTRMEDGWAFQAGGVSDPQNYYEVENGIVVTKVSKRPYCLLHQYERIPELNKIITTKYE